MEEKERKWEKKIRKKEEGKIWKKKSNLKKGSWNMHDQASAENKDVLLKKSCIG